LAGRLVFAHDGRKYHLGGLRLREVEELERLLACRYVEITPGANMHHKIAVMAMLLRRDHSDAEVEAIVGGLSLDQVEELWSFEDDDLPEVYEDGVPLARGGPSTPT